MHASDVLAVAGDDLHPKEHQKFFFSMFAAASQEIPE